MLTAIFKSKYMKLSLTSELKNELEGILSTMPAASHADFRASFTKEHGKPLFRYVYTVHGTDEELAAYKEARGEYYNEEEATGYALFNSSVPMGNQTNLKITSNGNIVEDNTEVEMQALECARLGGNLGQELAKDYAKAIISKPKFVMPAPRKATASTEPSTGASKKPSKKVEASLDDVE